MREQIPRLWIGLSLMLCLLIQMVGLAKLPSIDVYDSREYLGIASSLYQKHVYGIEGVHFPEFENFRGEVHTRMRMPGYPLFLVLLYEMLGHKLIIVQVCQVILNIVTLYISFVIGKTVFRDHLWPGTLVVLGLYFPLWLTSAFVLTEALFTFFLTLFMLFLRTGLNSSSRLRLAAAGTFLGAAFLTRPIALLVCIFAILPIWFHVRLWRETLAAWAILTVAFMLTMSPWLVRNIVVFGDYTPLSTDGGYNLWYGTLNQGEPRWWNSPEFKMAVGEGYYITREADAKFREMAMRRIMVAPVRFLFRGILRAAGVWTYFPGSRVFRARPFLFSLCTFVQAIVVICAFRGVLAVDRATASYLLLPAVSLTFILLATKAVSRFVVPAMPFVLLLAGQGLYSFGKQKLSCTRCLRAACRNQPSTG